MKRSLIRWTARVLLGILVSVQGAYAAAACAMPERDPARAIAQTDVAPCHELESQTDGLCVLHCLGDQQSLDKPSVKLPALGDAPVLIVVAPALHPVAYLRMPDVPVRMAAPPPRILFSRFLI